MFLKNTRMKIIIPLALMSVLYLALMLYSKAPLYANPVLPDGWETQTSLGFFYTLLLIVMISRAYNNIKFLKLKDYISHLGTLSWEIFLVQMVLIGSGLLDYVSVRLFQSSLFQVGFKVVAALIITLSFAELYNRFLNSVIRIKI